MKTCFHLSGVDLVFGKAPVEGFLGLDQGKDRDRIMKETGQWVGLQGVSFDVYEGEIFVLMGLSGSGKSSLLRCLNGMNGRGVGTLRGNIQFMTPSGQAISISSCTQNELREVRRHHISMVFQQFALMPWRTVWQNVEYPLEIKNIPKAERKALIEEKLELVGLAGFRDRYPHELSGGMQQRVGLARAFVTQANVLLMDEPFSALDPLHRRHLQDEVLKLQEKLKKTIIFVTHDIGEAARIASRMAVIDSGRILQLGPVEEIFSRPACETVRRFTASVRAVELPRLESSI